MSYITPVSLLYDAVPWTHLILSLRSLKHFKWKNCHFLKMMDLDLLLSVKFLLGASVQHDFVLVQKMELLHLGRHSGGQVCKTWVGDILGELDREVYPDARFIP